MSPFRIAWINGPSIHSKGAWYEAISSTHEFRVFSSIELRLDSMYLVMSIINWSSLVAADPAPKLEIAASLKRLAIARLLRFGLYPPKKSAVSVC
jgi:hypothetical protein